MVMKNHMPLMENRKKHMCLKWEAGASCLRLKVSFSKVSADLAITMGYMLTQDSLHQAWRGGLRYYTVWKKTSCDKLGILRNACKIKGKKEMWSYCLT